MTAGPPGGAFDALATDYDGTLASGGTVDPVTIAALDRVRAAGHRLVLVTGRVLRDLERIFPAMDRFDLVVAENGALLFSPASGIARPLGEPPPAAFVAALRQRGVTPLQSGRVIVATREPHEAQVLEVIRRLGLEREVIFNKGAVMVLPSGVNKATGLRAALDQLELDPSRVIAVGDAENDHSLLGLCGWAVAVANATPALQERADWITRADHGAGVVELIERWLGEPAPDLAPSVIE